MPPSSPSLSSSSTATTTTTLTLTATATTITATTAATTTTTSASTAAPAAAAAAVTSTTTTAAAAAAPFSHGPNEVASGKGRTISNCCSSTSSSINGSINSCTNSCCSSSSSSGSSSSSSNSSSNSSSTTFRCAANRGPGAGAKAAPTTTTTTSTAAGGAAAAAGPTGVTMQRRSASERDLVESLVPRRRQSPSRADRGLFTLPRFPLKKGCSSASSVNVGRRDIKYTALENGSDGGTTSQAASGRSSRSTERRSILSSIVRSFSVKRPHKKNLSLSNGDLTGTASSRPTAGPTGQRNDEACDYAKNVVANYPDAEGTPLVVGGMTGVRNHGNTCYLNAIVQCLSNTDAFAEYLVLNRYQLDLLYARKNNRRKYGTRGEVTEQLALLIKSLWSSTMYPEISARLKGIVGKYGAQYSGSEQHDAQEFLIWLLDKVHEDLNRASKTKYKKTDSKAQSILGKPDEVLAARALASHARCNSSFVQELFQGQTKLTLTCPLCRRECKTFDPYVCLSLPIPLKRKRLVPVHLVGLTGDNRQVEFVVELFDDSTIRDLRERVSDKCRIPARHLLFMQLLPDDAEGGGFGSLYADSDSIASLHDDLQSRGNSRFVTCLETPKPKKTSEHGEHIMIIWHNRTRSGGPFGPPYVVQVRRDISFDDLRSLMLATMSNLFKFTESDQPDAGTDLSQQRLIDESASAHLNAPPRDAGTQRHLRDVDPDGNTRIERRKDDSLILLDDIIRDRLGRKSAIPMTVTPAAITTTSLPASMHLATTTLNGSVAATTTKTATASRCDGLPTHLGGPSLSFSILCADMLPERNEIRASDDLPLYTDPVEHITAVSKVQYPSVAKHLRLVIEWHDERVCERIHEGTEPLRDESLRALDESDGEATVPVDLNDCLNAYFSEELLEAEEAWLCPTCDRRQQVLSKLDLWTTPDILLIHLKRFKQVNHERSKITSLVDFPLTSLDLSRFTAQRGESPDLLLRERDLAKETFFTWSPWKSAPHRSPLRNADPRNSNNLVYDLYAVCNHHGTMQTGHYTAFCKNPVNGLWYHYDDATVSTVTDESHLVTRDAYILFYQRNTLNVSQSCSSSSSGYSSGSNESAGRHWSVHREQFFYSSAPSTSFDSLFNGDRQAQTPQPRRKWRNTKRYATLGPAERRGTRELTEVKNHKGRQREGREHRPGDTVLKDAPSISEGSMPATGASDSTAAAAVASCGVVRESSSSTNINELYAEVEKHVLGPATYCTVTSV